MLDAAAGAPIADVTVMLRYNEGELTTRTNGDGSYAFSFDAAQPYREPYQADRPNILGLLFARDRAYWGGTEGGHWTAVLSIPWGTRDIVQDVRLRPVRTMTAGESMLLSIEPDSSLVWDQEWDPWTLVAVLCVLFASACSSSRVILYVAP